MTIEEMKIRVWPDGKVTRRDAATYLARSPKTLAMWALEKRGPPFRMIGGRCFYHMDDLRSFAGEVA